MSTFYFHEWLYILRKDGKPRALRIPLSAPCTVNFTEDIKKVKIKKTSQEMVLLVRGFSPGAWPVLA
jgi:hypothetical protein